jgi:hypothetical protein
MGLNDTEAYILAQVAVGRIADLGLAGGPAEVEASFLRRVLLGLPMPAADHARVLALHPDYPAPEGDAPAPLAAPGLRLAGAVIAGRLDLSDCIGQGGQGLPALALEHCRLEGAGVDPDTPDVSVGLDLSHARLARLSLRDSQVTFVSAVGLVVDGPLDISGLAPLEDARPRGVDDAGLAQAWAWMDEQAQPFVEAAVGGQSVSVDAAPPPRAPSPPWPRPAGAHCWLDLRGCRVSGRLSLSDGRLCAPPPRDDAMAARGGRRHALVLAGAEIGGGVTADRPCRMIGGLDLSGARLHGDLVLTGCELIAGEGAALSAPNLTVGGKVLLNAATVQGGVDVSDARLSGNLEARGAFLDGAGGRALAARNARIEGDVVLNDGTVCVGPLDLNGMEAGFLHLSRVRLYGDVALTARHARLAQVEMLGNCTLIGMTTFASAEIRAELTIIDSVLIGPRGTASLELEGARIGGGLTIGRSVFNRVLNLRGAAIEGEAILRDLRTVWGGHIFAPALRVGSVLTLRELKGLAQLDLTDASCATLDDHPSAYGDANLDLSGLTYARLATPAFEGACVDDRAGWLAGSYATNDRPRAIDPQPYQQLARVLSSQGLAEDARDVQVLLADRRRAAARSRIWADGPSTGLGRWALHVSTGLFGALFGHGLKPTRAVMTLAVAVVLGWGFFSWTNWRGAMVIDQQAVASLAAPGGVGAPRTDDGALVQNVPCGDAVRPSLYALDVFIPLIDLLQETECEIGAAEGVDRAFPLFRGIPLGPGAEARTLFAEVEAYRFLKAFYAIAGWLILSLSILTFSGVMQRSSDAG